jgi:LAO/AO transport system kinase
MKDLIQSFISGDVRALARLITTVEEQPDKALQIFSEINKKSKDALKPSYLIGITGPPGAGKSTLIDNLISRFRKDDQTVGVIAIDPTSPFTGGAVLGDRIRMQRHSGDIEVYIRSLGTRGSVGGISRATRDVVRLLELFGKDVIIIETVGVGQVELDIMKIAQTTLVVLVPESGDVIQTMKAGLMEIADILIVNKSDREGADRLVNELKDLKKGVTSDEKGVEAEGRPIPVFSTEGISGKGITEVYEVLRDTFKESIEVRQSRQYLEGEFLDLLSTAITDRLPKRFKSDSELRTLIDKVGNGEISTYDAVFKVLLDQQLRNVLLE